MQSFAGIANIQIEYVKRPDIVGGRFDLVCRIKSHPEYGQPTSVVL